MSGASVSWWNLPAFEQVENIGADSRWIGIPILVPVPINLPTNHRAGDTPRRGDESQPVSAGIPVEERQRNRAARVG